MKDSGLLVLLAILVLLPLVAKLFADVFIAAVNKFRYFRHKTGDGRSMTLF
jgi:hypothetical protein